MTDGSRRADAGSQWYAADGSPTPLLLAEMTEVDLSALLAELRLYVNWRGVTKQLTTPQKEVWARAVEAAVNSRYPDETPYRTDRWWQCPTCGEWITNGPDDGPHRHCQYAEEDR